MTVRAGDVAIFRKKGRRTKRQSSRVAWTLQWDDNDDWSPYVTADVVLAEVSIGVLDEHVKAIEAGVRAGSGQRQPILAPGPSGDAARAGLRPDARGHTGRTDGKGLSDMLTRSRVKARGNAKIGKARVGTAATCEIGPGSRGHAAYFRKEFELRGVQFLDVDGRVAARIDVDLNRVVDIALAGLPFARADLPDFGEIEGSELK